MRGPDVFDELSHLPAAERRLDHSGYLGEIGR
jgi:hypothetical protein